MDREKGRVWFCLLSIHHVFGQVWLGHHMCTGGKFGRMGWVGCEMIPLIGPRVGEHWMDRPIGLDYVLLQFARGHVIQFLSSQ